MRTSSDAKILLAMDFDHTVVDGNTDVDVQGMTTDGKIPDEIRALYSKKCWTDYMQKIFELLHTQGQLERHYRACICRIPFTRGMRLLLRHAAAAPHVELILISDSNSLFIQWILEKHGLDVDAIFTNPAEFDADGCLRIRYYHTQDSCKLSTRNLCKGRILQEYVQSRQKQAGVRFKKVVYVGDGKNDLCPASRLKRNDVVCARIGYTMEQLLKGDKMRLKADVRFWQSGCDIFSYLDMDTPPNCDDEDDR